jgi:HEAT repeat protein
VNPVQWDKASIAELHSRLVDGLLTDFAGSPSKDDLYRSVEAMGNSRDPEVRGDVMNILFRLDPEQAFSFLTRCLADPDEYVRWGAIDLLGGYGERITPFLIPLLQSDPCPDVRTSAAAMLGYFGTQEAIPALKVAAEHDHAVDFDEHQVSRLAKRAIKQIKARYREGGNPNRYRDVVSLTGEQEIEEKENLD